ncbi:NAD(P)-binding protein [Pleurotus eryngii]|uniref:NAD(P)-binding protein n=1 Tax=Pleurotus eryngii TaxID=5323 RepID=A0A9P6DJN7_PLEER|nr:NAD(P)-binding protein [Pleurotus eryngii]
MASPESATAPTPPVPALALFSLHGTVALVTGAARGIGQACAIALAEAGADVVCVLRRTTKSNAEHDKQDVDHKVSPPSDRTGDDGGTGESKEVDVTVAEGGGEAKAKTQGTIAALGVRAYVVYADLEDMADVKSVWARALGLLGREEEGGEGKPRIHILVNCAGVQRRHPSVAFPEEDWDTVLDVNLKACFLLAQAAGNHFLSFSESKGGAYGRGGKIINFCSLLSYQGGFTVPAYAASKGALMQLTKALSNEWAHANVQVNGVSPGYVRTDIRAGKWTRAWTAWSRRLGQ